MKIVEILEQIAKPLGLESTFGAAIVLILAVLVVLLLSYFVGSLVQRGIGAWSFEVFEEKLLKQIPGYQIVSNILKGFAEKRTSYPAAMVQLAGPGASVFGFIMEEHDDGSFTVFVPSSPALTVGSLHVLERDRVTLLEASSADVANCISQWGVGSKEILDRKR
jgi:uncharacterized membrane protein